MRATVHGLALTLLITLPFQAQACPRIVSQSPYLTHNLQWLGLEDCIVGVSRYDTLDRPQTGGVMDPDAGAIAVLQPELVFASDRTPEAAMAEIVPEGAQGFRLDGFTSMTQLEDNLMLMGRVTGISDIEARVTRFRQDWRQAAHAVGGDHKRILLLTSCSGNPYSFGRKTWLYELFQQAGFQPVETVDKIRHVTQGEEAADITALADLLQAELIFIFERTLQPQCKLINPRIPVRIISLDGEQFLHPAPVLLEGLKSLQAQRNAWTKKDKQP